MMKTTTASPHPSVTLLLSSGHSFALSLAADDPLLGTLLQVLSEPDLGRYDSGLLRIPLGAAEQGQDADAGGGERVLLVQRCHVIGLITAHAPLPSLGLQGPQPQAPAPEPALPPLALPAAGPPVELPGEVPRAEDLIPAVFAGSYRDARRPVILCDPCGAWSPEHLYGEAALRERHGAALVEVQDGGDARLMCLRDFLDLIEHGRWPGAAEDRPRGLVLLVTATGRNGGVLGALLQPPAPFAGFVSLLDPEAAARGRGALWYGAAGARHHGPPSGDLSALLVQVRGRQRVRVSCGRGGAGAVECVLLPGEALYLPAGLLHELTALEAAMTLSFYGAAA